MIRLCGMRWRNRRSPSDILVGKVGNFWVMFVPRSGRDIGKDDAGYDLPDGTLFVCPTKPFDGLDVLGRHMTSWTSSTLLV